MNFNAPQLPPGQRPSGPAAAAGFFTVFGLWHVKAMLEHLGCYMLTAADGEEADMVFREHADEITCAILDLTMPKVDGWLHSASLPGFDRMSG